MLGREQREEARLRQEKDQAGTERMERAAFINALKGDDLLAMMFGVHSDKEEVLLKMPQARETQAGFKSEFLGILQQLYELGLSELKQRETERIDIEVGINKAKGEVEEDGVAVIEAFVREKETVFQQLEDMAEQFLDLDPETITDAQVQENYNSITVMFRRTVWTACEASTWST